MPTSPAHRAALMSSGTQEKRVAAATEQRQVVTLGLTIGHATVRLLPGHQTCPTIPTPALESSAGYLQKHPGRGLQRVWSGASPHLQPPLAPLALSPSCCSHVT